MHPALKFLSVILFSLTVSKMQAQDSTATLVIYGQVADMYLTDISLFINGQSIYPAPLGFHKKLIHLIRSSGKMTLLAKATNKPGYKSAAVELDVQPGKVMIYGLALVPAGDDKGLIMLNDVTSNVKYQERKAKESDKWTEVNSVENRSEPYIK